MHLLSSIFSSRRIAKSQDSLKMLMVVQKRATMDGSPLIQKALCQINTSSKARAAEQENMILK